MSQTMAWSKPQSPSSCIHRKEIPIAMILHEYHRIALLWEAMPCRGEKNISSC